MRRSGARISIVFIYPSAIECGSIVHAFMGSGSEQGIGLIAHWWLGWSLHKHCVRPLGRVYVHFEEPSRMVSEATLRLWFLLGCARSLPALAHQTDNEHYC